MKNRRTAKHDALRMIRTHGAHGTLIAIADALKALGPAFEAAALDVECVTGYAPSFPDDARGAARCSECMACQEYILTPEQAPACSRDYAYGGLEHGASARRFKRSAG